jgi:hypothetical protein
LRTKEYLKFIDKADSERLRIKIRLEKGKVFDIVVQFESFINNNWTPVVRYDCSHGFFHRDVLHPNGTKEKKTIAIKELDDALLYAEQDLKDHWEFYKDKYVKKLKK